MGKGITLLDGERVEYRQRCNAEIPRGRKTKTVPGVLTVTNRRLVHTYAGLFGLGASRHEIPLARVSGVGSESTGFTAKLEVFTVDGEVTRFALAPARAEAAATAIRMAQAEQS